VPGVLSIAVLLWASKMRGGEKVLRAIVGLIEAVDSANYLNREVSIGTK